jgi:hypothetical protein
MWIEITRMFDEFGFKLIDNVVLLMFVGEFYDFFMTNLMIALKRIWYSIFIFSTVVKCWNFVYNNENWETFDFNFE